MTEGVWGTFKKSEGGVVSAGVKDVPEVGCAVLFLQETRQENRVVAVRIKVRLRINSVFFMGKDPFMQVNLENFVQSV